METVELVHWYIFRVLNETDISWDMKFLCKVFDVKTKIDNHFITIVWISVADKEWTCYTTYDSSS